MQIALCMPFGRHTQYVQRTWPMEVYFRYLCYFNILAKYKLPTPYFLGQYCPY